MNKAFEPIANPYAFHAGRGVVDPNMFFGRRKLIQRVAHTIRQSDSESKCVMIYGQKRSGKSTILHHLERLFHEDKNLLVLNVGSIWNIEDPDSTVSFQYQMLMEILEALKSAIGDRVNNGFTSLDLSIPNYKEFYTHSAPLQLFTETFEELKGLTSLQEDWHGVRVVLLIDEFQYIYARIVDGRIPESFMQSWKALLQANYFHTVLVGQDVMPKFKARFPNEFGTTQDEHVTYLKSDDASRLIDEPIRIGGRKGESRYREQAIERILDLTAGNPFYIQIICDRLIGYMNARCAGLVTEADVEHVKNELIYGVNALGLDKFDNLINSGDISPDAISAEDSLKVLTIIADNSSRKELCPRERINCKTDTSIDAILDELVERDVVERHDKSYRIKVGLFREWLAANR